VRARAYIGGNACCQPRASQRDDRKRVWTPTRHTACRPSPEPFQTDLLKDRFVMAEQKNDNFLTNWLSTDTVFQNAATHAVPEFHPLRGETKIVAKLLKRNNPRARRNENGAKTLKINNSEKSLIRSP
jgi:hypothetical protein